MVTFDPDKDIPDLAGKGKLDKYGVVQLSKN